MRARGAGGDWPAEEHTPNQSLTFGEMHRRSNALARGLTERGVVEGDSVAVMCRNHRGFVDACIAVAKLGADILLLNTAFAGPRPVVPTRTVFQLLPRYASATVISPSL